jgi:hypothetical protein
MTHTSDRPRIFCIVPGCPHWRGDRKNDPLTPTMEWICSEHWRMTSRTWRRRRALFRRRGRLDLDHRMWQRLKTQATERAMGIA